MDEHDVGYLVVLKLLLFYFTFTFSFYFFSFYYRESMPPLLAPLTLFGWRWCGPLHYFDLILVLLLAFIFFFTEKVYMPPLTPLTLFGWTWCYLHCFYFTWCYLHCFYYNLVWGAAYSIQHILGVLSLSRLLGALSAILKFQRREKVGGVLSLIVLSCLSTKEEAERRVPRKE